MSFGSSGFGGFGQTNNNQQSSAFGGFGQNNNNNNNNNTLGKSIHRRNRALHHG
jgi:nuclear pore complex protein Nup98-Nup96